MEAYDSLKTSLEDTEAEKALKAAFLKEFQKYKPFVRKMTIAASKDVDYINLEIAQYRKEFDMSLPASYKKILAAKGSLIESSSESKKSKKSDTKLTPSKSKNKLEIKFKMIDWNQFSLEGKVYTVEFNPFDGNPDNVPYTITSPSSTALPIFIYLQHPNGKTIVDALNKQSKNKSDKFLLQLIVFEAVEIFLNRLNYKKKEIQTIKEVILER